MQVNQTIFTWCAELFWKISVKLGFEKAITQEKDKKRSKSRVEMQTGKWIYRHTSLSTASAGLPVDHNHQVAYFDRVVGVVLVILRDAALGLDVHHRDAAAEVVQL